MTAAEGRSTNLKTAANRELSRAPREKLLKGLKAEIKIEILLKITVRIG